MSTIEFGDNGRRLIVLADGRRADYDALLDEARRNAARLRSEAFDKGTAALVLRARRAMVKWATAALRRRPRTGDGVRPTVQARAASRRC